MLGISDAVIVNVSPEKSNIMLACREFNNFVDTFGSIARRVKVEMVKFWGG